MVLVLIFHREISTAQKKAIRESHDSFVKGPREVAMGRSKELIRRIEEAVYGRKTKLHTDLDRMLAICDPDNKEVFISEVCESPRASRGREGGGGSKVFG